MVEVGGLSSAGGQSRIDIRVRWGAARHLTPQLGSRGGPYRAGSLASQWSGFGLTRSLLVRSRLSWRPSLDMMKRLLWSPTVLPSLTKQTGQTKPRAPPVHPRRRPGGGNLSQGFRTGLPGCSCPTFTHTPICFTSLYRVPSAEWYRVLPPSQGGSLNHPAAGGHQKQGAGSGPWQVGPS